MSSDEPSGLDDLLTPPASLPPDTDSVPPVARRGRLPFRRSTTDRYLAGIAGGEGHRLGIDPFFLRVALVGVTLLFARGGGGTFAIPLLAYLAAWLMWPTDEDPSLLRRFGRRSAQQEIGGAIAAVALAAIVIGRPSLIWAGLLLGAAVALLGKRADERPPTDRPLPERHESPDGIGPDLWRPPLMTPDERAASWGRSLRGAVAPRPSNRPDRPPRPPRRSPALWPLTASLLLAYVFGCALLDNLLDPGIDPGVAVNGAIFIIGGVILLSGWRGRAMATSLLLLPLVPFWVAFSVANTPRFADTGTPARPAEGYADGARIEASKGYGELLVMIDADDLPESGAVTASVDLTAGQVDVWVPKEAKLHITGHIGLGQLAVYDEFYGYDSGDPFVDYGLDRTYHALGRTCYTVFASEGDLRNAAEWSGVGVSSTATSNDVADAIEEAGYPRPTSSTVTEYNGYYEDAAGVTYDTFGNQVEVDPATGTYQRTEWSYQANNNSGLCLPVPPPTDPVLITIDATIGLGNLKVHRV